MKKHSWFVVLMAGMMLCGAGAALGAEKYADTLKEGDEQRAAGSTGEALSAYRMAVAQANNNTERALALAKQAEVLAYDMKDYEGAREAAEEALAIVGVRSVARVIALRARAECYVKADENYPAAIEALEEALALEDVDWALPGVALSLGDAYRLDGQAHKALEAYRKVFDVGNASRGERAVAHLNMGLTYQYTLRDHAKAREAYRVAGDLNPDLKSEIEGHLDRME